MTIEEVQSDFKCRMNSQTAYFGGFLDRFQFMTGRKTDINLLNNVTKARKELQGTKLTVKHLH